MQNNIFSKKRFLSIIFFLTIILIIVISLNLNMGTLGIKPNEVLKTIIGQGTKIQNLTLFTIRMPRIAIAILVGSALAISGTILQATTKNDLAEPGILGITSGATLFVVIYIFLTNGQKYYGISTITIFTMPLVAFLGGISAATLVYILALKKGMDTTRLLLMGIAVNAAFSALIIVAQLSFKINDFNKILLWTSGSIWGTSWQYVFAVAPGIITLGIYAVYKSRYLDVCTLNDESAISLGINIQKQKLMLMIIAVGLASLATSVAGSISFVGLIAPHIARKLVGPKHRYLIGCAMLIGIILVIVADTIARNLFAPIELYLGIVISIIGVPYFIYLMMQE